MASSNNGLMDFHFDDEASDDDDTSSNKGDDDKENIDEDEDDDLSADAGNDFIQRMSNRFSQAFSIVGAISNHGDNSKHTTASTAEKGTRQFDESNSRSGGVDHGDTDGDGDRLDENLNGSHTGAYTTGDTNRGSSDGGFMDMDDESDSETRYTSQTERNRKSQCEYHKVRDFAETETRRARIARVLIIGCILLTGAAVSVFTYAFLIKENDTATHTSYERFASSMYISLNFKVLSIKKAFRTLSHSITVSSLQQQQQQQQQVQELQIESFESHAQVARKQSDIDFFIYTPLVTNLTEWIEYTQSSLGWYQAAKELFDILEPGLNRSMEPVRTSLEPVVWKFTNETDDSRNSNNNTLQIQPWDVDTAVGKFAPRLLTSPPPAADSRTIQNEDFFSLTQLKELADAAIDVRDVVFSEFTFETIRGVEKILNLNEGDSSDFAHGKTFAAIPIYKNFDSTERSNVMGYAYTIISWEKYLLHLLPKGVKGINVLLRNSCGQLLSYEVESDKIRYLGTTALDVTSNPDDFTSFEFLEYNVDPTLATSVKGHCVMYVDIYHTKMFNDSNSSNLPVILTCVIAALFIIMASVFFFYDYLVRSRDEKVDGAAARSNAIVSSLFPSNVRDRLLAEQQQATSINKDNFKNRHKQSLKGFLAGEIQDTEMLDSDLYKSKPIADLFPDTTVMFGDIVGFTAWSSVREPQQVFTLLETLYRAFDEIANRRRIFKVETVGDCYVAVCGLPDPRKDHAVNIARFARDCLYRMWTLTSKLEVSLGPETSELAMRVGLHSGPVTAGVLRGERARFQLFGDTMNTAARMESNGARDRIHLSQETAELLVASGKSSWVVKREDKIIAKGKGELQTFWLSISERAGTTNDNALDDASGSTEFQISKSPGDIFSREKLNSKITRMIEWNVEVLHRLLQKILAKRILEGRAATTLGNLSVGPTEGYTVLDEVKEIITLPQSRINEDELDANTVNLEPAVLLQLTDFVTIVASMYRENPFHNFEHASHVTMSVTKLLSRIVAPSDHAVESNDEEAFSLHDHTYGITSDPLTQFACVFSALIHDMDHPGVPNAQLVKEGSQLAVMYKNKSAAEQHSVDLAWQILMQENYSALRASIYCDETEMRRFRQLVVNSVMATDIVDKELKTLRNSRWEKAFSQVHTDDNIHDTINRKATIVIEHLIQASDVAHTMQHWHIYRKWNLRFFMECYAAYKEGRAESDPSINWYQGEIGFFDFYIIPLAKKLKDCGVFGVSSDEYLNYAMKNRQEWEERGKEALDEMMEKANQMYVS